MFGLAQAPPAVAEVIELVAGGAVSGRLVAAAGPDLHLETGNGVVVLDTRLMTGWELVPAAGAGELTWPVRPFRRKEPSNQDALF